MSTTGTEKHCRLCLMLNKGGTQACHILLLRRVEELTPADHQPNPWTIHQFLQSRRKELSNNKNISKEKLKVLFPICGVTDLSKWDLSLFCTILTIYCELEQLTRLDVERLRTLRNTLCHMNDPNIDDKAYKAYFEDVKLVVKRILQGNSDDKTKQAIEKILNDIHEGPLSLAEAHKGLHTFYSMEMDIREKLEHIQDVDERVLLKVEKFDKLFEKFDSKLEQIDNKLDPEACSKLHSARDNFLIPETAVFLDLKDADTDEEQRISVILEELFEEVLNKDDHFKSTIPAESYIKLRGAVRKTFELFLEKGWRITSARHECVRLHIRCLTFKSLAALFREHIQGNINRDLTYLNTVVSESLFVKKAHLETVIYKEEFWSVLDKTISAVDEFLTDQDSDTNPTLHEKPQHCCDQKKHALSLTASNVTQEGPHLFEKDCENELETCLRLIESELKTEFNAPHVSMQASYTPKRTQKDTDQEGQSDESVTPPKEIEAQKDVPLSVPSGSTSKTVDEEYSAHGPHSEVEDKGERLQTIAVVELYRSQRAIAQYLELAYLSLHDYPDIAGEIRSTSESARHIHLHTFSDVDWFGSIFNIIRIFCRTLDQAYVHHVIEEVHNVKDSTEISKERYTELQGSIQKHITLCEKRTRSGKHEHSGDKQVQPPLRNIKEAEKAKAKEKIYEFENLLSKINVDEQKLSVSEKDMTRFYSERYKLTTEEDMKTDVTKEDPLTGFKINESIKLQSFKHDEAERKLKKFEDQNWRSKLIPDRRTDFEDPGCDSPKLHGHGYDKKRLLSMPRPGASLTGGLSRRGMKYISDNNRFGRMPFSRLEIDFDVLKEAYMKTQEETGCTTQPLIVQRMITHQKETLDRLEKIRTTEEFVSAIECLREVDRHLTYIDLQLTRLIECWSKLIADFESLKWAIYSSDLSTLRLYLAESGDMIEEEWDFVKWLLMSNRSRIPDYGIYRFVSLPRQSKSGYRAERKQELLNEIENDASGMYLPPDSGSGKSFDQHSDTDDEDKELMFKQEETSGKPKQMQSQRGRLLPFFKQ